MGFSLNSSVFLERQAIAFVIHIQIPSNLPSRAKKLHLPFIQFDHTHTKMTDLWQVVPFLCFPLRSADKAANIANLEPCLLSHHLLSGQDANLVRIAPSTPYVPSLQTNARVRELLPNTADSHFSEPWAAHQPSFSPASEPHMVQLSPASESQPWVSSGRT